MAYVDNQEDTQNQQAVNAANPSAPQTSTGTGGATAATNVSGPQGAVSVPSTTKAPPVQDLHAYLTANAPQAVQQGQRIGANLSQAANKVTGDINADQSAFDQNVQAQNVAPNSDLVNQAALNPAAFVQDPNNLSSFLKQRDASYSGPSSYQSSGTYQGLQNEVTNAANNAPDINKPGGLTQLVTGQEKNPTVGKQNLDSLLLQENPDALAPIKSALALYPNLQGYLTSAGQTENQAIQNAITNATASQAGVRDRFLTGENAVVPGFGNSLAQELSTVQGNANKYNDTVNQNHQTLNPMESQLKQFMDKSHVSVDDPLSSYLAQNVLTEAPTQANASTAEDYAKNAALEQLLGESYTPFLSDANSGQAGSYAIPDVQAANGSSLAQQVADNATQSLFTQKAQPAIQGALNQVGPGKAIENPLTQNPYQGTPFAANWPTYLASLQNNVADTSPASQSNYIAHGQPVPLNENNLNFYNEVNPSSVGYNTLLEYLQSVNPSGITGKHGQNYTVNS